MEDKILNAERTRYAPQERLKAGDLYVHQGLNIKEISERTGIPEGTLGRWHAQDGWGADRDSLKDGNATAETFEQTCYYLMRTMRRLSQRLFESTIAQDDDTEFILPDENIELRINRLSLAYERIQPMGAFMRIRQRLDLLKEIKQLGYDLVSRKEYADEDMMRIFKFLDRYVDTFELSKLKTE